MVLPEGAVSWGALAAEVAQTLARHGIEGPERNGRIIVMRACGAEPEEWPSMSAEAATKRGVAAIDAMTARRVDGEPLQYVIGEWSFRHLDLYVDSRVLIPRPETEVVAGLALTEIERVLTERQTVKPAPAESGTSSGAAPITVVDLGTGSGAIGLSIVTEHPRVEMWLTDASPDALAVARANLVGIGRPASRVRVAEGSWFAALPDELRGRIDVVVSNPPYVADDETLPEEVARWEPTSALFAGPGGTEHLDHLVETAPDWLAADGSLLLEMAPDQIAPVAELARSRFEDVTVEKDLTGRDRATIARRPRR